METRPKVLVVEDDEGWRETVLDLLEEDGGFHADGAANAAEAMAAVDRCTYDVAVVDINLNNPDPSNRDGIDVVKHLRWLGEGTQSVVWSDLQSRTLVRDMLRKHGANDYVVKADKQDDVDYLDKVEVESKGNAFLIAAIKSAAETARTSASVTWDKLSKVLSGGGSEEALVYALQRAVTFKGGQPQLSTTLTAACRHFVPLLQERTHPGLTGDAGSAVFSGRFWSKGQGTAIEILVYGANATLEMIESRWNLSQRNVLNTRTKANLSVVVLQCPELDRSAFFSAQ